LLHLERLYEKNLKDFLIDLTCRKDTAKLGMLKVPNV